MSGSSTTGFQYPWSRTPESSLQVGGMGRGFLSHSQNSGGIIGRPLSTKMESLFSSFIPGHQRLLFIPGHQHLLVYTRSSTSSVYTRSSTSSCLYQVINVLLFLPGHQHLSFIPGHPAILCLYQGKRAIHTSGRGVVGASWAGIISTSCSWAVCLSGAWASTIHASGMVLGGE